MATEATLQLTVYCDSCPNKVTVSFPEYGEMGLVNFRARSFSRSKGWSTTDERDGESGEHKDICPECLKSMEGH